MTYRETIKALLDGKKVQRPRWRDEYLHVVDDKLVNHRGLQHACDFSSDDWQIYEEPEKTVSLWLWACKGHNIYLYGSYYSSEEELRIDNPHVVKCVKIESSKIELPESWFK